MTVEIASPTDAISENKDVYFELLSPAALPSSESMPKTANDSTQRFKYEFKQASDKVDTSGPVVSEAESWEKGNTLVLSDYEIGSFRRAARAKASVAAGIAALGIGFIVYVAGMNNWTISINKWDRDVKRAFFLQNDEEVSADLVEQMNVTLGKGYTLKPAKGKKVGIIQGEIQNNSQMNVSEVLLEGRILDATKKLVTTVIQPCDVKIPDRQLRNTRTANIPKLFIKDGVPINCEIKSGYSTDFKIVFHELPRYFNSTYIFEVHPYSAKSSR